MHRQQCFGKYVRCISQWTAIQSSILSANVPDLQVTTANPSNSISRQRTTIYNRYSAVSTIQLLTHSHAHTFHGPLDFVRDYPVELVPEPIWILLEQETVSGSGISWAICTSAPHPRLITTPATHHSVSSILIHINTFTQIPLALI